MDRVNQAEYGIHILVIAPQEYVNIYSTRRVATTFPATASNRPPYGSLKLVARQYIGIRNVDSSPLRVNPVKKIPISKSPLKLATPIEPLAIPGRNR